MISCSMKDGELVVMLTGWHWLLACKRQVRVPLTSIVAVQTRDFTVRPPWCRAPGTCIPGIITAGTYYGRGRKEFWMVRGMRPSWVIELQGQSWTRVVLDVDVPTALQGWKS